MVRIKSVVKRSIRMLCGETLMVRSLNRTLMPVLRAVVHELPKGVCVIDVGAKNSPYASLFADHKFFTVDASSQHNPNFVCRVEELDSIFEEHSVDLVICTEVLEHVSQPLAAVEKIFRVLKPGGRLVASTPFLVPYHPDPHDFYRYTKEGWAQLTHQFCDVRIVEHGSKTTAIWYLMECGRLGQILRPFDSLVAALFTHPSAYLPLGFVVVAQKARAA